MVTDTKRILRTDPGRPEVCNVCQLHRSFGDDYEDDLGRRADGPDRLRRHEATAGRADHRATTRRAARALHRAHGRARPGSTRSSAPAPSGSDPRPRRRWPRSASGWACDDRRRRTSERATPGRYEPTPGGITGRVLLTAPAGAPVRHPAHPGHDRAGHRRDRDARPDLLRLRRHHPDRSSWPG